MLDAIEKQRKILSANSETTLNIECLLEDEDLRVNMTRADLEQWMEPWAMAFKDCCETALKKSGLDGASIEAVEMVGEGTRMPLVQEISKQVFAKEQCSRTQNSLECIAKGCALQCAMLLPQYQVANYVVNEYNQHSISMTYFFKNAQGEETKKSTSEIFKVGANFPKTKVITFDNKKEAFDLVLHYTNSEKLLNGLPQYIAHYQVQEAKPKHDKFSFILRISNDIHNVAILESAELQEEWEEEQKIPVKKHSQAKPEEKPEDQKKEGEEKQEQKEEEKQEYEVSMKKKKGTSTLKHHGESYAMNKQQKEDLIQIEQRWFKEDNMILELKAIKNSLEAYSYNMRGELDQYGSLRQFIDPTILDSFLAEINQAVDWLYGEGANASKDVYVKKFESLRKVGDPVKMRKIFFEQAQEVINEFQKLQGALTAQFQSLQHMTQEDNEAAAKAFTEIDALMQKANQVLQQPKHLEVGMTTD